MTEAKQPPPADAGPGLSDGLGGCAECGKTSTPTSMWALYCVDCIEHKIAPAFVDADHIHVSARPLEWDHDSSALWTDRHHGFAVMEEPGDALPFCANWGEGDAEQFATLDAAKAWCQAEIDRWMARYAVLTPNAKLTGIAHERTDDDH